MRTWRGFATGLAAALALLATLGAAPAPAQNEQVVDTLQVAGQPQTAVTGDVVLQPGVRYRLTVTGTTTITSGADHSSHDAMYCFETSSGGCVPPFPDSTKLVFGLRAPGGPAPGASNVDGIERFGEGDGTNLPFDAGHRYEQFFVPSVVSRLYAVARPGDFVQEGVTYAGAFTVTVALVETVVDCTTAGASIAQATPCRPRFGPTFAVDPPGPAQAFVTPSPKLTKATKRVRLTTSVDADDPDPVAAATGMPLDGDDLVGICVVWGLGGIGPGPVTIDEGPSDAAVAVLLACVKLLAPPPAPGPRAAAAGCPVAFVPVVRSGASVGAGERRRAVAAAKRRMRASCGRAQDRLTVSLRPRRKRASVRTLAGARLSLGVARTGAGATEPAPPGARLLLRWSR